MQIQGNTNYSFQICPEGMFNAVCVDITPLKDYQTEYGIKKKFNIVFELEEKAGLLEDGRRFLIWSKPMTPSLQDRAAFRAFLKSWRGHDIDTKEAMQGFDADSLIGRVAFIVVKHNNVVGRDGKERKYANIDYIGEGRGELAPSGQYIRVQDRVEEAAADAVMETAGQPAPTAPTPAPLKEDFIPTPQWAATIVHVGNNAGKKVGELSQQALQALHDKWIPIAGDTDQDKALVKAINMALCVDAPF